MVWTGEWVAGRLGVSLSGGDELPELLGLALRRNPKRAHLLVSNVLGKHVPQRPGVVHGAGVGLGRRVRELLGDEAAARSVVLGYAETATGLGHSVADGLALAPVSALHPPAGARAWRRRAGSRRSTATPPRICCSPRTADCSPGTARWCSSTTSSPPAAPS